MSGLYPRSRHVKDLSDILYNKTNPVTMKPRWQFAHPEVQQHAGNLPDVHHFDYQFFKVHHRMAFAMDVQARKILEQAYQAIYDAGVNIEQLNNKRVGVYIGTSFVEMDKSIYTESFGTNASIQGNSKTMFANRISYWLNVKGPSVAIDAACCSSTTALEQGFLGISRGECEAAIIGGTALTLHPQSTVALGRIVKINKEGKIMSFDQNADGLMKTEAVNILFLQKAKDAKRIYAEVLHVKNEFLEIPEDCIWQKSAFYRNPETVVKFLKQFYEHARISPDLVEYVEAFGSAVPDADKSELETIDEVFCQNRSKPLMVGSVMSNIGYGESATGISSITKVLLGYHTGELAANLHCDNPRSDIPALREGRMRIVNEHQRFQRTYAAVNGMSVTGVNAHVLLHGRYKPKIPNRYESDIPYLVTISGRKESAVANVIKDLKSRPIDPEEIGLLHNIHQTRISGHMGRGYVILGKNEEQKTTSLGETASYFDDTKRPLCFVYSGMGSQWAGMGSQLMRIPVFAAAIERCHKVLEPKGLDIVDIITSQKHNIFDNILNSFVGIAAVQIGLTDVLTSLGLEPDIIIGHSVGELGCAYADGCFTAEEMILSAYCRGLVSIQTNFIHGTMAAIGIGYQKISELVPPEIDVACHNSAKSCTISGPTDAMEKFVTEMTKKGIFAKAVASSNIAYHSRYIACAGPSLLKHLEEVIKDPKPRSKRWLSTSVPQKLWGEPIAQTSSAEYHTNNLLNPVLFEETSQLISANAVLVEIAPHGLLQAILKRSLPEGCKHIAMTRRAHPDNALLVLDAIAKLYMEGYYPKIQALYPQVEFPVSTGTPMLSHLVEWAHDDIWPVSLFTSADRTTAALCKFVLSVHDDEHRYLQGNVVRGKTLYPFSAALVAVWDTLAMYLQVPKKQLSVEFRDVHLFTQPLLHVSRQLTLNVAIHKGTGQFEVLDEDRKVANGYIVSVTKIFNSEYKLFPKANENMELTSEDVYQLLFEREYFYKDDFRSIHKVNPSLTEAFIIWNNNWVTFLDGIIQFNILRQEYNGVSRPTLIRNISIDVKKHLKNTIELDGKTVMKAAVLDLGNSTRCGAVVVNDIKFHNLPPINNNALTVKAVKFVPRFQTKMNLYDALDVYLQIVSENTNKDKLRVLVVENSKEFTPCNTVLKKLKYTTGIEFHYEKIQQRKLLSMDDCFLADVDLVLVEDFSSKDNLAQYLNRWLPHNSFLINVVTKYKCSQIPSKFRTVSSMNTDQCNLELVRRNPEESNLPSIKIFARTKSELEVLIAKQTQLSKRHKILIISTYPAVQGLKDFVKKWRKNSQNNHIYLIMLSSEQTLNKIPELNLAFNVFYNNIWGGEYCTSWQGVQAIERAVSLTSTRIGDLDSLQWVETSERTGPGIPVTVHYAAINDLDVKRATGEISLEKYFGKQISYGMDFSGITDNGVRVMGVMPSGAVSGRVLARPELLWPVPEHWSLEEAATVPSAYLHAYYCLCFKSEILRGNRILVHGGAGALGQAVINLALACDCEVFTTVGDIHKKKFLMRLFPKLKGDHIGNSRDLSFLDMVMNMTQGKGCHVVISCVKGNLKDASIKCTRGNRALIDVSRIIYKERFSYGMFHLTYNRNYTSIDLTTVFENERDLKKIQLMMAEGISSGNVRPLSRVIFTSDQAPRAFRLQANSRHRGRVLIDLRRQKPTTLPRLTCSPDSCHLVIAYNDAFGLCLAEKLIKCGVKKLVLHFGKLPRYLGLKIRSWNKLGVEIFISSEDLKTNDGVTALLKKCNDISSLEGVYVVALDQKGNEINEVVEKLDKGTRKCCSSIRYFAIFCDDMATGQLTCLSRVQEGLPATILNLSVIQKIDDIVNDKETLSWRNAADAMELALRSSHHTMVAQPQQMCRPSLLQEIAHVAEIDIPEDAAENITLHDLGIDEAKVPAVGAFLNDVHDVSLSEEVIPTLSVERIRNLEKTMSGSNFEVVQGLGTYFSYVDSDELLATTEMVFLPTLANSMTMKENEFDVSETYLFIVPGLENHHQKFRVMCERLKLPAVVFQADIDRLDDTPSDIAARFVKIILHKFEVKETFYLLGYEHGVTVALEMAAILEKHGLKGTVYCVGGTPEELQLTLQDQLQEYNTEESLRNNVTKHMSSLMMENTKAVETILQGTWSWQEKNDKLMRLVLGKVARSAQYAQTLIEAAYKRIVQARSYKAQLTPLNSQLILLHASSMSLVRNNDQIVTPKELLQRYSTEPVIVYELKAPLAYAAADLRCAGIINRHLDDELLKAFELRNLCETHQNHVDTFIRDFTVTPSEVQ